MEHVLEHQPVHILIVQGMIQIVQVAFLLLVTIVVGYPYVCSEDGGFLERRVDCFVTCSWYSCQYVGPVTGYRCSICGGYSSSLYAPDHSGCPGHLSPIKQTHTIICPTCKGDGKYLKVCLHNVTGAAHCVHGQIKEHIIE